MLPAFESKLTHAWAALRWRRRHSPAKWGSWQSKMGGNSPFQEDRVVGFEAMVGIWSGRSMVAFVKAGGGKWIGKAVVVVRNEIRASLRVICWSILVKGFA